MEAISFRLKELEKVEAGLYLAKQVTLKSRALEDAELQRRRQALDEAHIARVEELEQEEDVSRMLARG